eukprot:2696917-Prymnesium_polylepis.2
MSTRSMARQSEWNVPIVIWSAQPGPTSRVRRSRSSRAACRGDSPGRGRQLRSWRRGRTHTASWWVR